MPGSQKGAATAAMHRTAVFSDDRVYRYALWRIWDAVDTRYLNVIGLNPSTADETTDDPTIRRCIAFAMRWGFAGLCMTNLWAYMSTDPRVLRTITAPNGPCNDADLRAYATAAAMVLVAWGQNAPPGRVARVVELLSGTALHCLGTTKNGSPLHPLYIPGDRQPVPWEPGMAARC